MLADMARIPDTARVLRLLESEGGSLGRRDIMEGLGISDQRYQELAQQLCLQKKVTKNRGRTGGLSITNPETDRTTSSGIDSPSSEVFAGAADSSVSSTGPGRPKKSLEKDLYPVFKAFLLARANATDESKSVVLETHKTRRRKWETPDLTEIRVTPFPMVGQWELRVVTYELKRQGDWNVDSVLQTAAYNEFAHESWLVVPGSDDSDWVEHFQPRVVNKAGELGIGLATFMNLDGKEPSLKTHMQPKRQIPRLSRQQEWLEEVIDRLNEQTRNTELAGNIRWAKTKADSGRD